MMRHADPKPRARHAMARMLAAALLMAASEGAHAAVPGQPIPLPALATEASRFDAPLQPAAATSAEEDAALLAAIARYHAAAAADDLSALEDFLTGHPPSGWRLTLLTDLGLGR